MAHWGGFQRPEGEEGSEGYVDALAAPLSGLGSVHNAYMYDHVQKSVLRTPFVSGLHPKPRHLAVRSCLMAMLVMMSTAAMTVLTMPATIKIMMMMPRRKRRMRRMRMMI